MKPSSSFIKALSAKVPSYDIMERVSDSLSSLNYPFYLSDLLIFEELIDLYYDRKEEMEPHVFFAMDSVIRLIQDPSVHKEAREQMTRQFTHLTGASPNHIALSDVRACERYRHALSVLFAVGWRL